MDARSFQALAAILDSDTIRFDVTLVSMADKMNLDYLKLLYCEIQKYEVMTMSVVGGQPKKQHAQILVIKQQETSTALL